MTSLEMVVSVSKVQDTKAKDDSVTVTLQGAKTVLLEGYADGFDVEDVAEAKLVVKLGSMAAVKLLGLDKYETRLFLVLKPRDSSLQEFEVGASSRSPGLAAYEGVVSPEVLDKLEAEIPEKILKEIA